MQTREDYVEMKVKDSMREGGEHYPFTSENVTEALTQMCFADQAMLASYIKMCFENHCNLDTPVHLADFVVDRVNDYWYKIAVFQAQEQYDKAGF